MVERALMQTPEILTGMILKLSGSLAGTVLSLLFMPPHSRTEAARRASASIIVGIIFAVNAREYLGLVDEEWSLVSASCLCALSAWWAMGAVVRGVNLVSEVKKKLEP